MSPWGEVASMLYLRVGPLLRGPLSHVWVSIAFFVVLLHILPLPHLRRRLCLRLHPHRCILSLSLSLSLFLLLLPLDLSVYIYIFSVRLPSDVSINKQRQVQS